jgi:hypothetical protein
MNSISFAMPALRPLDPSIGTLAALSRASFMKYLPILFGLLLGACSTVDTSAPLYVPPSPPTLLALREGIKKASTEEKLTGPIEMSALRNADRGFGQYFVCMRAANPSAERHAAYSVFFSNDEYKGVRQSVMIEACETQLFSPLN